MPVRHLLTHSTDYKIYSQKGPLAVYLGEEGERGGGRERGYCLVTPNDTKTGMKRKIKTRKKLSGIINIYFD